MAFDRVHNVSKIQLWVLPVVTGHHDNYRYTVCLYPCRLLIKAGLNKDLSLMKVTHYLIRHPPKIIVILKDLQKQGKPSPTVDVLAKFLLMTKEKELIIRKISN